MAVAVLGTMTATTSQMMCARAPLQPLLLLPRRAWEHLASVASASVVAVDTLAVAVGVEREEGEEAGRAACGMRAAVCMAAATSTPRAVTARAVTVVVVMAVLAVAVLAALVVMAAVAPVVFTATAAAAVAALSMAMRRAVPALVVAEEGAGARACWRPPVQQSGLVVAARGKVPVPVTGAAAT